MRDDVSVLQIEMRGGEREVWLRLDSCDGTGFASWQGDSASNPPRHQPKGRDSQPVPGR